jgi:hypothetical protein
LSAIAGEAPAESSTLATKFNDTVGERLNEQTFRAKRGVSGDDLIDRGGDNGGDGSNCHSASSF